MKRLTRKNLFRIPIVLAALLVCASCNDTDGNSNKGFRTYLSQDYEFVLGLLVPDEDQVNPTEVVVGRLFADVPDSLIRGVVQDTFMMEQVLRWQNKYIATLKYHDDATVTIRTTGQEVVLQHIGSGTYRDVGRQLMVIPRQTYSLEVRRPGDKLYTDTVTVPGDFEVTNISPGDTLSGYPKRDRPESGFCYYYQPVIFSPSEGAHLYRIKRSSDRPGGDPYNIDARFTFDNSYAPAIFVDGDNRAYESFKWKVCAFDSSFSKAYQKENLAAFPDVFDFLDYWNYYPRVVERSSIDGHGTDVIGNFGAYNAFDTYFTVEGLKDSCACWMYPPGCP